MPQPEEGASLPVPVEPRPRRVKGGRAELASDRGLVRLQSPRPQQPFHPQG